MAILPPSGSSRREQYPGEVKALLLKLPEDVYDTLRELRLERDTDGASLSMTELVVEATETFLSSGAADRRRELVLRAGSDGKYASISSRLARKKRPPNPRVAAAYEQRLRRAAEAQGLLLTKLRRKRSGATGPFVLFNKRHRVVSAEPGISIEEVAQLLGESPMAKSTARASGKRAAVQSGKEIKPTAAVKHSEKRRPVRERPKTTGRQVGHKRQKGR